MLIINLAQFFYTTMVLLFQKIILIMIFIISGISVWRILCDFPSGFCYDDGHDRAENVEEAEREVNKSRNAEYSRLGHATSVPWYEYGSDCGSVFRGTAQQFGLESLSFVCMFIHVGSEHDRQELVARDDVKEYARRRSSADERSS